MSRSLHQHYRVARVELLFLGALMPIPLCEFRDRTGGHREVLQALIDGLPIGAITVLRTTRSDLFDSVEARAEPGYSFEIVVDGNMRLGAVRAALAGRWAIDLDSMTVISRPAEASPRFYPLDLLLDDEAHDAAKLSAARYALRTSPSARSDHPNHPSGNRRRGRHRQAAEVAEDRHATS